MRPFLALALTLLPREALAGTLLVVGKSSNSISMYSVDENESQNPTLVAEFPTAPRPHEIAVSPDGHRALVTVYGSRGRPGSTLGVLGLGRAITYLNIELGTYTRPHGVAWLPDSRHALVTAEGADSILLVDVLSETVVAAAKTGGETSHMVAVSPDGRRAYVTSARSGTVTRFDIDLRETPTLRRGAVTTTGAGAEGVAVCPSTGEVWVTNRSEGTISVLSGRSLKKLRSIHSASGPIRVGFSRDGQTVLVTNANAGSVSVLNAKTHDPVRTFSTRGHAHPSSGRALGGLYGMKPVPVGVAPVDGESAWVANSFSGEVVRYDYRTGERLQVITAGREPGGLAWSDRSVR